ncbi:putative periplasmic or secreted lipoprotein [Polaromonas sp. CF318]|uniref:BON domain-containing protein n=1 Tax=Polaromonas sp. CF318 TaxID=1144318 RepID=UPI00027100D2|nr:BON domain-containing protein [Polaromonas sp. CF318]EJL88487.1 putative periplasmic or secreted lipoprotein [Polaromonas sp. CF318]
MKTDMQLKADVTAELAWEPAVNAAGIGVLVNDGIVTLTGHLDTFAEKYAAERAVRRVAGVRGLAMELDVKLAAGHQRSDSEIATAAASALRWSVFMQPDRVKVEVEKGWVTLTGEVDWAYQSSTAEQCVRNLIGVRGLTNKISVKPTVSTRNVASEISAALERQAEREAKNIAIDVEGSVVTLRGKVHSLAEREAAAGAAFAARGVTRIVNKLEVTA